MRRMIKALLVLALLGLGVFWFVTRPDTVAPDALAGLTGDANRGEAVFWAGGCASCHSAVGAEGEAKLVLSGGQRFASPFGTFLAPNISSDPQHGIGGWSDLDLANAMLRGVSPAGQHYFPAFPYGSYVHATLQDVADLRAYLATLPASDQPSQPHEVGFPFNIRRSLGGWKLLFLREDWVVSGELNETEARGRYLVEALGHCGECHTPRNALGGLLRDKWLAGAPDPSGKGNIPNITPAALDWSDGDLEAYFTTGLTPDFDSAGGHMVNVIENLAKLDVADRAAIIAYLRKVPPVTSAP